MDFCTHDTFKVYRDVILNIFSGAGKELLFKAPHYKQFYATKIFNETLSAHSGEFHFLSSQAWGDCEQCLGETRLTTCWHSIWERRGHHRCCLCREPDVKKGPPGGKNERNANDPKGDLCCGYTFRENNWIFPILLCPHSKSPFQDFFCCVHNWKVRTRLKKRIYHHPLCICTPHR